MGRTGVSWRVWAVLICLQITVICADVNMENKNYLPRNSSEDNDKNEVEARGKKKKLKYLVAVLIGAIIVKGIILPLALKAVSLVAGKAFLLSAFSVILSSIVGFKQFAQHGWDRIGTMPMRDRGEVTENSFIPMSTEAMYQKLSTDHYWSRKMKNN